MEVDSEHKFHIDELKKLSYAFYCSLAQGKEPLTYTAVMPDSNREYQVEVNAYIKDEAVHVDISFDTSFGGRFDRNKGQFYSYRLSSDGTWTGSRF